MTLSTVFLVVALMDGNLKPKEPLRSGPPVGAANDRSGFRPEIVTGAAAGQRLCPVWNNKFDLVALIVVREKSDSLTGLVKKIDQRLEAAVGKTPRALGAYVMLGGVDGNQLRGMAECESLKRVNLCIGGLPQDYAINGEADVTVVIYNVGRRGQQKVMANFAFRKGELTEASSDAIVKALSDVLPK